MVTVLAPVEASLHAHPCNRGTEIRTLPNSDLNQTGRRSFAHRHDPQSLQKRCSATCDSRWARRRGESQPIYREKPMPQVRQHIEAFWRSFLDSQPDSEEVNKRFYESFRVGSSVESADEGARHILDREKSAMSSLLWEYGASGRPLPLVGDFSVVENGKRRPVCVVETTWIEVVPFDNVETQFAYEYGEGSRTLEGWRKMFWKYYSEVCETMNREMLNEAELVCERFQVVFPK